MPEFRTFLLKTALQQFLYHLCPEKLSLSLIHDPVIRIQTNDMKIIFQDVAAEAVDGGDLGTLDQRKLPVSGAHPLLLRKASSQWLHSDAPASLLPLPG